jgi:Arrestin (or S-antigen), N-terminal domain
LWFKINIERFFFSVEGKFGFVRYKVEVHLDIPLESKMTTEKSFIVMRHEDLNNFPELRLPNEVEETKLVKMLTKETLIIDIFTF